MRNGRTWMQWWVLASGLLVFGGCGGCQGGAGTGTLQVSPESATVSAGATASFTAVTVAKDGKQTPASPSEWVSSDTTIASVAMQADGSAVATGLRPGDVTITAISGSQRADATLMVTAAQLVSIAVTPATPSLMVGATRQLIATATYGDATTVDVTAQVSWTSSAPQVATVDNATSKGLVHGLAAGTAELSAALGGVSGRTTVTVTAAQLVSIAVTPTNPQLARGTTRQLTATGTYSDATTQDVTAQATWTSSAANVATVSDTSGTRGLATAVNVGTASLSATVGSVTASTTITVTAAQLVSIAVTPTNPQLARGTSQQLTATGTYSDATTQDLSAQATWSSSNANTATVSNTTGTRGLVTAVNLGTATISASSGSITGSTTLTVTAARLVSIAVTPTNPQLARGTTRQLTATGTYSDATTQNLTAQVAWSSSDANRAAVSNAAGSQGLVSAVNVGAATVSATASGVTGSTAITVTAAQLVSIAVTPTNPSLARGSTQQLTATGTYSDATTQDLTLQVAWSSSNANVAAVSNAAGSKGLATAVNVGAATVTASAAGVTGSTGFTVTAARLVSIDVTPTNPSLARGTTQQLTATGTYTDATTQDLTAQAAWSSSNANVAPVSNAAGSQGLATASNVGTATVTASFTGITGSTALTVTAARLVSIDVTPTNPSLVRGSTQQLTATGTYSDTTTQDVTAQVTWSSSDTTVATVSNAAGSQGLATALGEGTATLQAALSGVTGSTMLTVKAAQLVSIAVTPTNPSLARGSTQQLTATGTYSDATTQDLTAVVTWASNDSNVGVVSNAAGSQGLATALNIGTATLSATSGAVTGSTMLTVTTAQLVSIAIAPANGSLARGSTQQLTATGTYSDATTQNLTASVTWASSAANVATVSNAAGSEGLATALNVGPTTVSATSGAITGSTMLTVTAAQLVSIAVTPVNPSLARGTTQQLTATGTYTGSTTQDVTAQVAWASSDATVATVSNAAGSLGRATAVNVGMATVSATLSGVSGSTGLTVTAAQLVSIAVTPANPSVLRGMTRQLVATATYTDASTQDLTTQATWASSDATVATVSNAAGSQGLLTGVNAGTATVSATFGGVTGSTAVTVTVGVTLTSVTVAPATITIDRSTTTQLTATLHFSDGSTSDATSTAAWSTSNATAATVNTTGLVTGQQVGSATITATSGGFSGTATVTVVIPCHVTINEVQTAGAAGASDEWVELYNGCSTTIDLMGSKLNYRSAAGTTDILLINFTASTPMAPGSFRLYAGMAYPGTNFDARFTNGLAAAGGGIGLVGTTGTIDSVGYGTATNIYVEGAAAPAPVSGKSIGRFPTDGKDTDQNGTDFHVTTTPTPRAANQ